MDWIHLISAAGFGGIAGSLATTLLQAWVSDKAATKQRNFEAKKLAYVEFLNAFNKAEEKPTPETVYHERHCINVCDLVGSNEISELLDAFVCAYNPKDPLQLKRHEILGKIKKAMRKDLGFN